MPQRFLFVLAVLWMLAMTWRLYPQFKDAVRVDGRLSTVAGYVEESCRERVGPAAATCLAESGEAAQRLLRREQGRSVLFVVAPLLAYFVAFGPLLLYRRWRSVAR